jgi:hypothetical protein
MSVKNRGGIMSTGETDCPPELSGNPTSSHIVSNQEELGERNEFGLRNIFVHTSKLFLRAVKSYDMGLTTLLPLRRKVCCGILSSLKTHRLGKV